MTPVDVLEGTNTVNVVLEPVRIVTVTGKVTGNGNNIGGDLSVSVSLSPSAVYSGSTGFWYADYLAVNSDESISVTYDTAAGTFSASVPDFTATFKVSDVTLNYESRNVVVSEDRMKGGFDLGTVDLAQSGLPSYIFLSLKEHLTKENRHRVFS